MSDQPQKAGFQFIPNPEGRAMTSSELASSAVAQRQDMDHQNSMLIGGALFASALLFVAFFLMRMRANK